MIVNYPKTFSQGKVENQLVATIDILPTMLDLCGIKSTQALPGNNLQSLDQGEIRGHKYTHLHHWICA